MALRRYQHKFLQPLEIDQTNVNTQLSATSGTIGSLSANSATIRSTVLNGVTTNNFFNSSTLDYNRTVETLIVYGDPNVSQGQILHIRNNNVSVNDADAFGGIKFSSSPGADFIVGKSTQLGTGFLEVRRENGTKLASLNGSGDLTLPVGNLVISSGNLVIGQAGGRGINFSATPNSSGSVISELFDDYEIGLWTPTYTGGSSYITTRAFYIKIGRQVTCYLSATILGPTAASFTATLPFASETSIVSGSGNGVEGTGTVMLNSPSTPANGNQITAYVWNSTLNFYWTLTTGGWIQSTGVQVGGAFVTSFSYIATY